MNIKFIDESIFDVARNSRLAIDEYVYDPNSHSPHGYTFLRAVFEFTAAIIPHHEEPHEVTCGCNGIRGDAAQYIDPSLLDVAVTMHAASPVTLYTAVAVTNTPFDSPSIMRSSRIPGRSVSPSEIFQFSPELRIPDTPTCRSNTFL